MITILVWLLIFAMQVDSAEPFGGGIETSGVLHSDLDRVDVMDIEAMKDISQVLTDETTDSSNGSTVALEVPPTAEKHSVSADSMPTEIQSKTGVSEGMHEPGWGIWEVTLEEETEILRLDIVFTAPKSAEGYLVVYWDELLMVAADQRLVDSLKNLYIDLPAGHGEKGVHTLSYKLESRGDVPASVSIENIALVQVEE